MLYFTPINTTYMNNFVTYKRINHDRG